MSVHHDLMMKALKTRLLPALRDRGFKGRFPHFRRAGPDRIDFVMIQFRREGGSFTINIGQSGPEGISEGPWADEHCREAHSGAPQPCRSLSRLNGILGRPVV